MARGMRAASLSGNDDSETDSFTLLDKAGGRRKSQGVFRGCCEACGRFIWVHHNLVAVLIAVAILGLFFGTVWLITPDAFTGGDAPSLDEVDGTGSAARSSGGVSAQSPVTEPLVRSLYTFGAPGAWKGAPPGDDLLLQGLSPSPGCTPGLRVYSSTRRPGLQGDITVVDPVASVTAQFNFSHPKMEVFQLFEDNVEENPIKACAAEVSDPPSDDFLWTSGHTIYESALRAHVDGLLAAEPGVAKTASVGARRLAPGTEGRVRELVQRAYLMIHFAFMIYAGNAQKLSLDAPDWGYALVGFASTPQLSGSNDHVALYQHNQTLECILVFEGTDRGDPSDIFADMDAIPAPWCGLGQVHNGFKSKLLRTISGADYRQGIKSKLPSCAGVSVTGHSLGGAQGELFTLCANRKPETSSEEKGFAEYQLATFERGVPAKLPGYMAADEESSEVFFLRNPATGLCLDVQGTMQTQSKSELVLYACETPDSNYSRDQRWTHTPDGQLVNSMSGLCADIAPSADSTTSLGGGGGGAMVLVQRTCGDGAAGNQTWELTPEGFLRSMQTGQCVDSKMNLYTCPYTDQKWRLTSAGFLENLLTGSCLDVEGSPGGAGSKLMLWPCEPINTTTDQRWDIAPDGLLKNRLLGLCVQVVLNNEDPSPSLMLAACKPEDPSANLRLSISHGGFLHAQSSGLCLDVRGAPGADGADIVLAPCEDRHISTSGLWSWLPGGFLRNVGSEWQDQQACVEVFGAPGSNEKLQDGAKLHLDVCKTGTDQQWTMENGMLHNTIGGRKCLDIKQSTDTMSHDLWLMNCAEWHGIYWSLTQTGAIRSKLGNRCIAVKTDAAGTSMDEVVSQDCDHKQNALINTWDMQQDGYIIEKMSGLCLGFSGDPPAVKDPPILLQRCGEVSSAHQRWHLTKEGLLVPRTLSMASKTCVALSRKGNGLKVSVCPSLTQHWELSGGAHIWNKATGACLDAIKEDPKASCSIFDKLRGTCISNAPTGYKLVTSQCDPRRSHQHWERISQ